MNIPIIGQDEIGPDTNEISHASKLEAPTPVNLVAGKLQEVGKNFERLKNHLIGHKRFDSTNWNSVDDIPAGMRFEIVSEILKIK